MSKLRKIFTKNIYWELFISFFRIGSFTIGGGYAMLPLIRKEVIEKRKWIEEHEFIDMLAMAQSAPGMISVNTAIFVGLKVKGFKGSLVTTMGAVLPAFFIILFIAIYFSGIRDNEVVASIFKGIRPAVVALIVAALYNISGAAGITWKTAILPLTVVLLIWRLKISPVWIVLATIIISIAYGFLQIKHQNKNNA